MADLAGSEKTMPPEAVAVEVGSMPKVVVCIPSYMAEDTIAKVVVGAQQFADQVIVCDDGSNDMTAQIAVALGAEVIRHEQTLGYFSSMSSLFKNAMDSNADFVVTIDGDGSFDSTDIPKLLERLIVGDVDLVVGSRKTREGAIGKSSSASIGTGLVAMTHKTLQLLDLANNDVKFDYILLDRARVLGVRIDEVPVKVTGVVEEALPEASKGMIDSFYGWLVMSSAPVFGGVGVLGVLGGLGLLAYALYYFFFASYLSTVALVLGVGSLSVGFILLVSSVILWAIKSRDVV